MRVLTARPHRTSLAMAGIAMLVAACGTPLTPGDDETSPSRPRTTTAPSASPPRPPDHRTGLAWALHDIYRANMRPRVLDARGRGRGIAAGDLRNDAVTREWQVCFPQPWSGQVIVDARARSLGLAHPVRPKRKAKPRLPVVTVYVVPIGDTCPPTLRYWTGKRVSDTMPDLRGWTPLMARRAFGETASLRFLDARGRRITRDPGDWLVCSSAPAATQPYRGVVVTFRVVRYRDGPSAC